MQHKPVLLNEVLEFLRPIENFKSFLDATFGRGGHTHEVLKEFPHVKVTALDRDPAAIGYGKVEFASFIQDGRLELIHTNYSIYGDAQNHFDGILMDLGVSSPQLDDPKRGFSFYNDGPLDMRMNPDDSVSAKEIVNTWTEEELANVFYHYGDVKKSFRVARAIAENRKVKPIETTGELSKIIERALGWHRKGHHPATECFLALRICVNNEFEHMEKAIHNFLNILSPGGRLLIITFHSAEDRKVKNLFLTLKNLGEPVQKKVVKPSREEQVQNPRSRSAHLRVFERAKS